jgi:hypothetical protein
VQAFNLRPSARRDFACEPLCLSKIDENRWQKALGQRLKLNMAVDPLVVSIPVWFIEGQAARRLDSERSSHFVCLQWLGSVSPAITALRVHNGF